MYVIGEGSAVLIRAIDMEGGLEDMRKRRASKKKIDAKVKDKELGNGPSKLTQAMLIDKQTYNTQHASTCASLWLEEGIVISQANIVNCARIGIDSAGEQWAKAPLRFYVMGNKSVSKKDKAVEALKKGKVAILTGGTGNPYFTTDSGAALRAIEIKADIVLKGTRIDGVYSADPEKDKSAKNLSILIQYHYISNYINPL